jgi:hypothetical protein
MQRLSEQGGGGKRIHIGVLSSEEFGFDASSSMLSIREGDKAGRARLTGLNADQAAATAADLAAP